MYDGWLSILTLSFSFSCFHIQIGLLYLAPKMKISWSWFISLLTSRGTTMSENSPPQPRHPFVEDNSTVGVAFPQSPATTCSNNYTVAAGDSCYLIAINNRITLDSLVTCTNAMGHLSGGRFLDTANCVTGIGDQLCLECSSNPIPQAWFSERILNIFQPLTQFAALNDTTIRQAVNAWFVDLNTATSVYGPMRTWNTSRVTDMNSLFQSRAYFNEDLSLWDTSSVTNMYRMFYGASSFNGNLSSWDTSRVTTMRSMFYNSLSFNSDVSTWKLLMFRLWKLHSMAQHYSIATCLHRICHGSPQ